MKKILHISTDDKRGAGSAVIRIHSTLIKKEGIKSKVLCMNKTINDSNIISDENFFLKLFFLKIFNRVESLLGFFDKKYYFFNKGRNSIRTVEKFESLLPFAPDIIILYWISGFLDIKVIREYLYKNNCTIYWYLLDMEPMTGGCHYSWTCTEYQKKCDNCPAVCNFYQKIPLRNFSIKKDIVASANIQVISPSSGVSLQLEESTIFKDMPKHHIMLGVDEKVFKPLPLIEINKIKNKYGIPIDKKVIFFGATNINEERKGGQYLKEALRLVANKGIKSVVLLTAGRKSSLIEFKNINFRCIHVGYLEGDSQLASAYQVADLFISPSMQDSGPMMVNESILCGTPVVAFNIGVALDLVITNETGYLAEVGEVNDLARGIVKIIGLSPIKLAIMKKKCRAVGMNKTSMRVISEKIISLISN